MKEEKENIVSEETEKTADSIEQEETKQEVSDQGLITDTFDHVQPVTASDEKKDLIEGKEGIRVQYGFTADEVKDALKIFQKYTIYKKNIIYSLIIAVLFVVYAVSLIGNPSSKFNIFMAVLCFTVLLFIWYFPLNHIRQTVKAISKMEYKEEYILTVYDNAVEIGEDENSILYTYEKDPIRIWETDSLFIIGYDKFRVFVIPKRCCSGKIEALSERFRLGAKEKYYHLLNQEK